MESETFERLLTVDNGRLCKESGSPDVSNYTAIEKKMKKGVDFGMNRSYYFCIVRYKKQKVNNE
ncbi:MAG: hypothetical protein GY757_08805 [bacterium]|nr:hypothetical protein [bacterium]